ncbi:hypothetical protein PMAYCL1PPCAC_04040 [Pristionchus mayeri]|uniref:Uncharacterized protein n=1 Tax=Pristionchus mayeri TaxID=1317129 RepID=A0AAN5C7P2_9BILA|nr:hypothetical protein PMAYCL1PPCAC_04040 [Pristionchus mayeri]
MVKQYNEGRGTEGNEGKGKARRGERGRKRGEGGSRLRLLCSRCSECSCDVEMGEGAMEGAAVARLSVVLPEDQRGRAARFWLKATARPLHQQPALVSLRQLHAHALQTATAHRSALLPILQLLPHEVALDGRGSRVARLARNAVHLCSIG